MATAWPSGLPGLGTGAESLARRITDMSDGRITVRVYAAGQLVPGLETFDAVQSNTAQIGHDTPGFHLGKHRAFAYFFGAPFGMSFAEHSAWLRYGGGQDLWDKLSAEFGLKSFAIGNIGTPPFGWFKKPLNSVDDLKGVTMRMPGLGAQMIRRLGAVPTLMAPGDVYQALQSGTLDATDFTGPANDMALGFHRVAKYYYWAGVHKPGAVQQAIINKEEYDSLPKDLRRIVDVACQAANEDMLAEYTWINAQAAKALRDEHDIIFDRLPEDMVVALGRAAGEILEEEHESLDSLGKEIWESYFRARRDLKALTEFGDQAFYDARGADFSYPNP